MKNLSTIAEPLHRLLKKEMKWQWGEEQVQAFKATKEMLVRAPILIHFDPSKPIVVHADASPYGIGAVLSHVTEENEERVVSFASRTLGVAERNYGHIEKEGLAIVFAAKKFHHYLFGHQFTIYTDHKPLLGLFGETKGIPERAAARIARWALYLSAYDYKLLYRPGSQNGNADGLSRLPLQAEEGDISSPSVSVHMVEMVHSPVSQAEVVRATSKDKILSRVISHIQKGWGDADGRDHTLGPYRARKDELAVEGGTVLWGGRVIIPTSLREGVLQELHEAHTGVSRMKSLARSYFWWPGMDKDIEEMVKACELCGRNQSSPAAAPAHSWEVPSGPWQRIHLDFAGPFMGKMFLIAIDAYSRWIEVEIMGEATSIATVNRLRRIFATHGLPLTTVTDNGPAFVGQEFKDFMSKNQIRHVYSAPYHPASNGQAERAVRTFKESMKMMQSGDVQTKLNRLLYHYRMTPHSTTGKSPAELLFGRKLNSTFQQLHPENSKQKEAFKRLATQDSEKKIRIFGEGDAVWYKNFGAGSKWLPGIVKKKLGRVTYEVTGDANGEVLNRHVDHLVGRAKAKQTVAAGAGERLHFEDFETEDSDGEIQPEVRPEPEVQSEAIQEAPRRSNRKVKQPEWLKDFELEVEDCSNHESSKSINQS